MRCVAVMVLAASLYGGLAGAAFARGRSNVLASRVLTPKSGGTVRAGNGVSIFVPRGVLTRPGR
jgi:hypothetical protein